MLRKQDDETINQNPVNNHEKNFIIKKQAEAAAEKLKYNNKPVKYIKKGLSGKNLKK